MKYNTILFDVDGTTVNSGEAITTVLQETLLEFGISKRKESLEKYIGPSMEITALQFFDDPNMAEQFVKKYRVKFPSYIHLNRIYEGIPELLDDLKTAGFKLGIATAKPDRSCMMTLDFLNITCKFDYVSYHIPSDSNENKKEIIERAMKNLDCDTQKTVMVGDSKFDLMGAEMAGIDGIGVLYGFGDYNEMIEYPHVSLCNSVDDLRKYFLNDH